MEASDRLPWNTARALWRPLDDVPSQRGPDPYALPRTVDGREARRRPTSDALQRPLKEADRAGWLRYDACRQELEINFQESQTTDDVPETHADSHARAREGAVEVCLQARHPLLGQVC